MFDSDVRWNENKTLLNKTINICTNNLDFSEGQDGRKTSRKGHFGMFCLCAHPTITIREHLLDSLTEVRKTIQGKIIISIGCLHLFQGLLYIVLTLEDCCQGSNLRLILGHWRTRPQVASTRS